MKNLFIGTMLLLFAMPAQAAHLSGSYVIPLTFYLGGEAELCVKLVSGGAQGIYQDQGSALMAIKSLSQTKYQFLGKYQLYKNHLSIVLGNYGEYASNWFLLTADVQKKQWLDGQVYDYYQFRKRAGGENGTFTATRVEGSCK